MKHFLKIILCGIFLFPILCVNAIPGEETASGLRAESPGNHSYASSSVLAAGKWVKIKIKGTGIYKITYEDLVKWGFSNPANVQLYGYGGGVLSENFRVSKIDDLPQISVWVERKNAGSFVAGDYILFYAKGAVKWEYNSAVEKFRHINNPYSDYGYYFITETAGTPTKQMSIFSGEENFVQEITTFNDYVVHEKDLVNIGKTGREFYGEDFSYNASQNFTMNTPGITGNGYVNASFVARNISSTAVPVTVKINGANALSQTISGNSTDYEKAKEAVVRGTWSDAKQETNTVNITYGATGHENTRLNYIRINYNRLLALYGTYTLFRNVDAINSASKYTVSGVNQNVKIWNVTEKENVFQVETKVSGNGIFFVSNVAELQEFAAVDVSKKDQFLTTEIVGEIKNQNLHALPQTDMVIISHPDFLEQAGRIAELHKTHDNLRVHVVTSDEIYNEFSSGTPDASAYRWFMKMFYDRGKKTGDEKELPKYLLLFGDGTFDNKLLITNEWKTNEPANKLLTYQSYNSLAETSSCVIEDYFGFLNDDDGWEGGQFDTDFKRASISLGIGRFPVRNATEAKNVTDKVIAYVENPVYGPWKNNVCFIADDNAYANEDFGHMTEADEVATTYFENGNRNYVVNKVYLETFQKMTLSSGYSYPDATRKIKNLLQSGIFMFNYTGHGQPSNLSAKHAYTINDAWDLYVPRLPFFITATCEFARFDDFKTSGGEAILLSTNGGIAAFSTTRVVYSAQNLKINKQLCRNLFFKGADGNYPRLGDAMRLAKRYLAEAPDGDTSWNKLSYVLIGDPALRLAYPEYNTQITSINGQDAKIRQTFGAGARVTITGKITNPDGVLASGFSGLAYLTLFDARENYFQAVKKSGAIRDFYDQTRILYTGKEPVTNGLFSASFVIPKDMSYSYEPGKLSIYAADLENKAEAQGYSGDFYLGGTDPNGITDSNPPVINSAYLNSPNFKSGDAVNDSPIFYAEVEDETGINISGTGIGRSAVVVIDNLAYETHVLNNYFEAVEGNPGKGSFKFTIPTLSPGKHLLKFRVWDIMNNSASQSFEFTVEKNLSPKIFDLYAFPNPAKEGTNFYLKHDRPDSKITIKIDVFNLSGAKQWSREETAYSDTFDAVPINWDLRTNAGEKLTPGVYVYRATISADGSTETTEAGKIIILAQ